MSAEPRPCSTSPSTRGDRVAVGGHGVEVAAEHDPAVAPELRARDHVGADGLDRERRRARPQPLLDDLGQLGLVVALRRHRDERGGETEEIGGVEVDDGTGASRGDPVVAQDVVELGLVVALALGRAGARSARRAA